MKKKSIVVLSLVSVLYLSPLMLDTVKAEKLHSNINIAEQVLDTNDMIMSEPMTFEELAEVYSSDHDVSLEEAYEHLGSNLLSQTERNSISPMAIRKFRTLKKRFTVTSTYKPELNFYCQTSESTGSFRGIIKILNVNMNRGYNGISKQFSGEVYTHLENANSIYYTISGDFFNNGTTSVEKNGEVGISLGGEGSVGFSISHASNHYKYYYGYDRRSF